MALFSALTLASCQSGTTPFYDFVGPVLEFQVQGKTIAAGGTFDAGNLLAGATTTKIPVTVYNRGQTTLVFTKVPAISVSGPDAANFTVDGPFRTTVTSDSSTSFLININGAISDGQISAALNLATNNGTVVLNITCFLYGVNILKDINAGTGNSNANNFVTMGSYAYFSATDGTNGIELWRTDGTIAGTTMVKDINAGAGNSTPQWLTVMNNVLYFTADNGINGIELWKSDGTNAGTTMVVDIHTPGTNSSTPQYLTVLGSTLMFQATTVANGSELYASTGATGNATLIDLNAGAPSSAPASLTVMNGVLYFSATDGTNGIELFSSDGTTGSMLRNIYSAPSENSSSPANFLVIGSTLYFTATEGTNGIELWKSDGTSGGTVIVRDIAQTPGSCASPCALSSSPANLTAVGSTLFFTANDTTGGIELWKSDGTSGGTEIVKDINLTGVQNGTTLLYSGASSPTNLVALGNRLYFQANDGSNGAELWVSDGTNGGTTMVQNIYAGSSSSSPQYLTRLGNEIYFSAGDSTNGTEIWKVDSAGAASLVRDINLGTSSSSPQHLSTFNGALIFQAYGSSGSEPYIYRAPK